jgi:chromosome segregation ATPase
MDTLKKVYNKLNSEKKTELAKHKIELSAIDDLKKAIEKIKQNNKTIQTQVQLTKKAEQNYESQHEKLKSNLEDVFDKGLKSMDDSLRYVEKQESSIKEIKKIAKELGVEVKEIKEFENQKNILDKLTDNLGENLAELKDIFAD